MTNIKMKIRKKDRVIVIAGKDKGKSGEVTAVMPKENRVLVSGINMMARHTKPSQTNPQGGIVRKEAPIHVSNVAHIDPKDKKPVRAGFKMVKDTKVRFARRSGEVID
jgi:large subunit ribosomal protein L24